MDDIKAKKFLPFLPEREPSAVWKKYSSREKKASGFWIPMKFPGNLNLKELYFSILL